MAVDVRVSLRLAWSTPAREQHVLHVAQTYVARADI
jgi:hypothetical protein